MDNKPSELSKPAAQIYYDEHDSSVMRIGWLRSDEPKNPEPLYSQEYVSALLAELDSWKRLAELMGENWEKDISDLLLARQRIDELEANGEALTVHYQCREIGEGGWMDCDKARYDYCQRRPEMDTRTVSSQMAELEVKDKTLELEREKSRRVMSENNMQAERITELEAIRSDASQVFKEIGNELGCNPDNESIMMAIDDLKNRLATPVRLPELCGDGENDNEYTEGLNDGINQSAKAVRAAGFTVEGDE